MLTCRRSVRSSDLVFDSAGREVDVVPVGTAAPAAPASRTTAEGQSTYRPAYERVAEQILELIAGSGLRPGDRMPTEHALAAELGTSRTVVREAVKILSALGRVRAQKGRGMYVADDEGMFGSSRWEGFFLPTDLDHIYMLFEFRRFQEAAAGSLAAQRATPAELEAIRASAEQCREGQATGRLDLFDSGDDGFHLAIASASHNAFVVAAVREARRLLRQSSTIGLRGTLGEHGPAAIEEHDAIYEAIRRGDAEEASQATTVHLNKTLEDYRNVIQRHLFG